MSGGHFDYDNDRAARSMFDWGVEIDYGLGDGRYYKTSVSTATDYCSWAEQNTPTTFVDGERM